MRYSQKIKYFTFGIVATAVIAPIAIYAVETIPVTFGEGDVISASVMNSVLKRVNDTQRGFTSSSEIVGTWACTTYSVRGGCDAGFVATAGGVQTAKTQNIVFSCNGNTCTATAATFFPGSCNAGGTTSQNYELNGNVMASGWGIHDIKKVNPSKFVWQINSSLPQQEYVVCEKASQPPAPADALTATVSGTSVALAWTDISTDETGFKVQYKTSARGSWTTATTTAANATSYTVSGLTAGTYWFRVVATSGDGDAMSSSEVQGVIQ
jgi:Fibronectin type III domain